MSSTSASQAGLMAMEDDRLNESFDYCRRLARAQARNFYYGMMLTPEPKRSAIYAVYAWMRAVDDLADGPAAVREDGCAKTHCLESFRALTMAMFNANGAVKDQRHDQKHALMWPAVRKTFLDYEIAADVLGAMIEGQLLDQRKTSYATFEELYDYCYHVAGVVGLVCLSVWGYEGGEATRQLAEYRGVALQLTNILRDMVEDAKLGRVYLPAEELAQFGFDESSFARTVCSGHFGERFDALMTMQLDRARDYYAKSDALESYVDPTCRPTCWALMKIYRDLLDQIARQPRRVLTERVKLSRLHKLGIVLRAMWWRSLPR